MKNDWILEVEDATDDVLLLQDAFARAGILNPVQVLQDGQQAIDYLAGTGRFSDRARFPLPALILLDLNIPKVLGLEVLSWIRHQASLNSIQIVVFSSSDHPAEARAAYRLGVSSYYVKPCNVSERVRIAEEIKCWFLGGDDLPPMRNHRRDEAQAGLGSTPQAKGSAR
jgi:CheY-like chemotaxis protein